MDRSSLVFLFVVLLATGGLLAPQPAVDTDSASTSAAGLASGIPTDPQIETADHLLHCFFEVAKEADQPPSVRLGGLVIPSSFANADVKHSERSKKLVSLVEIASAHHFRIEPMIALVPDPVESHLNWEFDATLDSIRRAFETKNCVLDKYHFPWRHLLNHPEDVEQGPRTYQRSPGVVLFRSTDAGPFVKLHVVFLIGETATMGVHKRALAEALSFIADWKKAENESWRAGKELKRLPVRLLGPCYSGSSWSVYRAMKDWVRQDPAPFHDFDGMDVTIIAGSATSLTNMAALDAQVGRNPEWNKNLDVSLRFKSTQIPQEAMQEVANKFILKGTDPQHVVYLFEENTAFGQASWKSQYDKSENPNTHDRSAENKNRSEPLRLKYPMLIGRMRSAYEKSRILKNAGQPVTKGHTHQVELSLDQNVLADDLPPSVSSVTPAAIERLVDEMLRTIAERNTRVVNIVGTDTLDILFLTSLIHLHCPNVQVLTYNADLVYGHPQYKRWCQGMQILTPYPLFLKNQGWTQTPDEKALYGRRQFQSSFAEGIYNATLALLAQNLDLGKAVEFEGLDFSTPFESGANTKPPLWLVTVGNGSLWPLKCYLPAPPDEKPAVGATNSANAEGKEEYHDSFEYHYPPMNGTGADTSLTSFKHGLYGLIRKPPNQVSSTNASLELNFCQLDAFGAIAFLWSCFCLLNVVQLLTGWGERWALFTVRRRPGYHDLAAEEAGCLAIYFLCLLFIDLVLLTPLLIAIKEFDVWRNFDGWERGSILIEGIALAGVWLAAIVQSKLAITEILSGWWKSSHPRLVRLMLTAMLLTGAFAALLVSMTYSTLSQFRPTISACILVFLTVFALDGLMILAIIFNLKRRFFDECSIFAIWLAPIGLLYFVSFNANKANMAILLERSSHLTNGVSTIPPAILLIAVIWCRSICDLRRLDLICWAGLSLPFPDAEEVQREHAPPPAKTEPLDLAGIGEAARNLFETLQCPVRSSLTWNLRTILFVVAVAYLILFGRLYQTFEGDSFRWLVAFGLLTAFVLVSLTLLHAVAIWEGGARLLSRLCWHPMLQAYERIPEKLKRIVARQWFCPEPALPELEMSLHYWAKLRASLRDVDADIEMLSLSDKRNLAEAMAQCDDAAKEYAFWVQNNCEYFEASKSNVTWKTFIHERWQKLSGSSPKSDTVVPESPQVKMRNLSLALLPLLLHNWRAHRDTPTTSEPSKPLPPALRWHELAEDFLTLQIVNGLRWGRLHQRNTLRMAVVMAMLALGVINSYPFHPHRHLLMFCWLLAGCVAITSAYIFVHINRDEVVSRISASGGPGRVTWDGGFVFSLLICVVVPLLAVLSMQFPEWQDYFSATNSVLHNLSLGK